jgi:hypothetical protein
MGILRAFKYVLTAPFHPMLVFGKMEDDPSVKLIARISFWIPFILLIALFYFLYGNEKTEEQMGTGLTTITYFAVKFSAIGLFLFIGAITSIILKFDNFGMQVMPRLLSLSILPEFVFLFLTSQFPEYYDFFKFFTYVWRTIIIILGMILLASTSSKKATIFGVITTLTLYFCNYNLFLDVE